MLLWVIDDSPADQALVEEALFGTDCRIVFLSTGDEALEKFSDANAEVPDLVLLDLNLPGISGRVLMQAARAHKHLRETVVVVLTSSLLEDDATWSYAAGANCHVIKPLRFDVFQSMIRSIVRFWGPKRLAPYGVASTTTRPTAA